MEREPFEQAWSEFTQRSPFRPYLVELVGGGELQVDKPEALMMRGNVAVHFSRRGFPTLFDHKGVARLVGAKDIAKAK